VQEVAEQFGAVHSLLGQLWERDEVQGDMGRRGVARQDALQGWEVPEVAQLVQNWEPWIWTWTVGELLQQWIWRKMWKMRLGQQGVEWVEAQSDQALVAPLGSPEGPDCASSGSVLQDLMHWEHCAQDVEVPEA
jgi:hypothetical protein